jgi:hypothetical protein
VPIVNQNQEARIDRGVKAWRNSCHESNLKVELIMKLHFPAIRTLFLGLLLSSAGSLAIAQYVWVDGKGVKQYSDVPPPASIPRNQILKEPGVTRAAPPAAATPTEGAPADTAKAQAPLTTAERNADFQKRKLEQADTDKKAAEKAKQLADKAANCEKARSYARTLDDGVRISTTDKNGERSILSDEQRATEVKNTQRVISDCK